ncbi:MFS-type transporter SLC18B1-like [Saccostrea echinata]|uniref:MFS-type transporter SLC18B1-like n=1 Tax=Saccostrea echinata TaxID=191078 RepID=UPI002A7FD7BF|nr:MFS-type transporter SLC18B1-like [Saccostrea echinata]
MGDNETEPLISHNISTTDYRKESLNTNINTKKDDEFSFSKIPKHRKVLLASMALVNFLSVTGFALLAPFFPAEAKKKGASQTVVGMIFGVFEFVVFLSAPVLGNYITKIGSKFMYLSGTMIGGICGILFGVLDKSPDGTIYIVMCFLCRTIEALGCSMFLTASFAIIATVFPDNVATVFSVLETFSGLGMIAGPAVGGALYQLGGFGLPFFVVGSITVLNGVLGHFFIGHINDSPRPKSKSILSLLRNPFSWVIALSLSAGSFSLAFLDPTLALHVKNLPELKDNTALIGLVFLIAGGIYTFTAPLWGFITDKKGYVKSMMAIGNLVGAVGYLLMGPTPLIDHLPFKLWSVILSLILMGLGLGCAIIPTFRGLIESAKALGMEENMDTHGMVSGLFNSCFSLGAFIGPTVGGALADEYGFDWSATVCAGLITVSVIFIAAFGIFKTWNEKKYLRGSDKGNDTIVYKSEKNNV